MSEPPIPTATDIMSPSVLTLRTDMRVIDAMRTLVRNRISGAPVVDDDGVLVGLVSEFDCLRVVASGLYGQQELEHSEPLGRVMSSELVTIGPDADVFTITQLLVDKRIRRVPVVSDGKLVGIVSRHDVLRGVHELRAQQKKLTEPQTEKGLYLSATDESGEVTNPFLD